MNNWLLASSYFTNDMVRVLDENHSHFRRPRDFLEDTGMGLKGKKGGRELYGTE